ncbi:MAG: YdcF family protein [Acidobacteria bacterium]|nr:YdcF family protein [Acidobacteriota bacterium]
MLTTVRAWTFLRVVVMSAGVAVITLCGWMILGGPVFIDRLVIEADAPGPAQAIVCLGGGLTDHYLPVEDAWLRIYTAVQLQLDGLAPVIVFSGGGTDSVSEAEVYAEAAQWLGAPPSAIALEGLSGSTAEHPVNLLKVERLGLTRDSSLIIVTSPLHSKRTAMCFRKAGYTNFRMVSSYVATRADTSLVRENRVSSLKAFRPNGKRYDDPVSRLRQGFNTLLYSLREIVAIGVYRFRGYV